MHSIGNIANNTEITVWWQMVIRLIVVVTLHGI